MSKVSFFGLWTSQRMKCPRFTGLWQNRDFMKFWGGETVSLFGSAVTSLALPLTAVLILRATPAQMGVLAAAGYLPFLVVGLLAGVWVDRLRRKPILMASDLASAALLGSIPVAALFGALTMEQLIIVAFLVGAIVVVDTVAYQSFIPTLVQRQHLVEANSKLEVSYSVAGITGPGIAGVLVQLVTAPIAIVMDSISFLVSALFLVFIRVEEPPPIPREQRRDTLGQIKEGLGAVLGNPLLRSLVWCGTTHNFFNRMIDALYVIYAVNSLHMQPALLGAIFAFSGSGALLGALASSWIAKRFGIGSTIVGMQILTGISRLLIPLAGGPLVVLAGTLMLSQFLLGVARPVFNITQLSLRQAITPDRLQGRVNATMRFVMWGVTPFGALIGGLLAESIGLQATMLMAGTGVLLAFMWVFFSPLREVRKQPVQAPEAEC